MADLDDDGDVEEIILASSTLIFSNCAIIFFNEYIPPPKFDVKSPPHWNFLEHLLQAYYGVDAPALNNEHCICK